MATFQGNPLVEVNPGNTADEIEEPNLDDPEDFVDDISDEGIMHYCYLLLPLY